MALYHKHRPQLWRDIIGQDVIVSTIKNQIISGHPAHAYLLSGSRGIGKTTTARLIAKALNCPNREPQSAEPCNQCSSCLDISASVAIDVIEIDAASNTGVDMVRDTIIENVEFQPTHSPYKIYIIDEAHMLSTAAFNALLKTLEEPPAYAILILASTELHKFPATIISRCQRYQFKKIPAEIMSTRLREIAQAENRTISEAVINRLIKKSEGSARDAVSLLDQIMAVGGAEITEADVQLLLPTTPLESQTALVKALANHDCAAGLKVVRSVFESGLSSTQFLLDFTDYLRSLLLAQFELTKKETAAPQLSPSRLLQILDRATARYQDTRAAVIPELPAELFVIECCLENSEVSEKKETVETVVKKTFKTEPTAQQNPPPNIEPAPQQISILKIEKSAVENVWNSFLSNLESTAPSLIFLLKMTQIISVKGNIITIGVQYSFHYDKLTQMSTKKKLEEIMSGLLSAPVLLEFKINENSENKNNQDLNDLAVAFGGQVI